MQMKRTRIEPGIVVWSRGGRSSKPVAKLDETVNGVELACNRFVGAIHPRGFELLTRFERGIFPMWEYAVGRIRIRKTIGCPRGENTTIVRYEVLEAQEPVALRLRPF